MDKLDHAVRLAERVVTLRSELAAAELELRRAFAGPQPAGPKTPPVVAGPVSQRVRDLLHDGRTALTFGELVGLVGGRDHSQAARAALKKLRAKKVVRFAGGKYSWTGK